MTALVLTQLALLGLLLATGWAAGWRLLAAREPGLLAHPITPTLGLAALAVWLWLLALCGVLTPRWVLGTLLVVHAAAAPGWRALAARLGARAARRRALLLLAAGLVAATPVLLLALYPPNAFDETTYHLPFARALAAEGALPWLPELRVPTFPLLAEALQAPLLWPGGDRATHLVAVLSTLLVAALLVAWGSEARAAASGWLAAAAWLGSPLVTYIGATGYAEPPLALCTTGAWYAAWRAVRAAPEVRAASREAAVRVSAALRWAVAAGFLAGSAAAVKYLGLYAIASVVALALLARGQRLACALAAGGAAVVTAAPTYLRLWLLTGNPVVPFFARLFGATLWTAATDHQPLGQGVRFALRLPYDAVLHRAAAGLQPPLSPLFLLSLPLLAWLAWRDRAARAGVLVVLGYLPLLVVTPRDVRYLMLVMPLWCLLLGVAAVTAWPALAADARGRRAAAALALLAFLPGALYAPFQMRRLGPLPADGAATRAFFARNLPGWSALALVARAGGSRALVYATDGERLFAVSPVPLIGSWGGPHRFAWFVPLLRQPESAARALHAMGATHLVVTGEQAALLRARPGGSRFTVVARQGDVVALAVPRAGR